MIYVITMILILGVLYAFLIQGTKCFLRKRLGIEVARHRYACLTFDDGPHDELTPLILKRLDQANIKATFFVLGCHAEAHPEWVERIICAGHEVGEHGYSHYHAWKTSPVRLVRDLWRCARFFERFRRGPAPVLFRPPRGKLSLMTWLYVIAHGRRLAFWNVDPKDYAQDTGMAVASHVIEHLGPGSVILLHDGVGNRERDTGLFVTLQALDAIIEAAAINKIRFATLGEALGQYERKGVSI